MSISPSVISVHVICNDQKVYKARKSKPTISSNFRYPQIASFSPSSNTFSASYEICHFASCCRYVDKFLFYQFHWAFKRLIGSIHYLKSVRICSFFGSYFPAFRLNTDQKNCEYEHSSCSIICDIINSIFYVHGFIKG